MARTREIEVGSVRIGGASPLVLIAGPCVIESEAHAMHMASEISRVASELHIPYIFKASYDKANRTSINSFRGPGLQEGLRVLENVKDNYNVPVLTDVHDPAQVEAVAEVSDILQIPAFLSRQTDLILAAAKTGRAVNLKKGQFLAPWEMSNAIEKVRSTGNEQILLTERGASFGYQNLVVDVRSFPIMAKFGYPVIFDVTHSVQLPGGEGKSSGGQPEFIEPLARAGVAAGVDAVFLEVHDNPSKALSDGTNALPLSQLRELLSRLVELSALVRNWNSA